MTHPRSDRPTPLRRMAGFTLIELMITVAIIGILARIAFPAYTNFVTRGKLVAMTNRLSSMRALMEQYYQDNRTYASVTANGVTLTSPCSDTTNYVNKTFDGYYTITCPTLTSTQYVITATATAGSANGATYTINQLGTQATTAFPTSWGTVSNGSGCWLMRKGDVCQ